VTDAKIPRRSYARVGPGELTWSEISTANRARAVGLRATKELVAEVGELTAGLGRATRELHRALQDGRVGLAEQQLRDRVEDLAADLVLSVDLLAERWSMDPPAALAQLFNERAVRDGSRERINPKRPSGRGDAS
jgi:hypothetical protein